MKIAFNAIRVSNKAGSGFDTFIINFINEFAKYAYSKPELNIDFDVYTLYPHHFTEVKKENVKQIKLPFFKQKIRSNSEQYSTKKNKIFKKLLIPIYYLLSTTRYLLSIVRFTLADYFRMFWTQFIFPFYARGYNFIIAMTQLDASFFCNNQIIIIYDLIPFIFPKENHKHKFFLYKVFPYIVMQAKHIVSISESVKMDVIRFFKIDKNKIDIVYAGNEFKMGFLVSEKERQKIKEKYNLGEFILYIGNYHPRKNLVNVIKSFYYLKQKYIDLNLVIIGYIPNRVVKNITSLVNSLYLQRDIKFLGHIKHESLKDIFSAAKVFVFPTFYEGFGLPPLEAMACGCPVIVSNCGALPEVCGDAAVYVNPYDPQDIANGILKVLTDEKLREQLIKKGFEQVKKFTWENSVIKFIEALKNLQNNDIK